MSNDNIVNPNADERRQVNVAIDADLHVEIKVLAAQQGVTIQEKVDELLRAGLSSEDV